MEVNSFDLKLSKNLHDVSVKSAYQEGTGWGEISNSTTILIAINMCQ